MTLFHHMAIHRLPNKYLQYGVSTLHTMHISCWDQVSHWILAVERSPTRMLETSTNSNPLCAITRHNGFKGEYISNKLGSEHVNSPMCMPTDPLNVSINLLQRFDGLLVQMLSFERLDRHLRTTMLDKRYASGVLLCRVAHLKTSGTAFSCQQITQSSTLVIRCFYFIQLQRVNNLSIRAIMHDNRCLELLYWIQRENFIGWGLPYLNTASWLVLLLLVSFVLFGLKHAYTLFGLVIKCDYGFSNRRFSSLALLLPGIQREYWFANQCDPSEGMFISKSSRGSVWRDRRQCSRQICARTSLIFFGFRFRFGSIVDALTCFYSQQPYCPPPYPSWPFGYSASAPDWSIVTRGTVTVIWWQCVLHHEEQQNYRRMTRFECKNMVNVKVSPGWVNYAILIRKSDVSPPE